MDGAEIGKRHGCLNIDVLAEEELDGKVRKLPVHVQGDARALPVKDGSFDCAVLGEILEHVTDDVAVRMLEEAKRVLRGNGRSTVVITMPHDNRRDLEGNTEPVGRMYAEGVYAYHWTMISRERLLERVRLAGLEPLSIAALRYCWGFDYETGEPGCRGTGVIAASC
jgi:SAM-dependent methyltransferase